MNRRALMLSLTLLLTPAAARAGDPTPEQRVSTTKKGKVKVAVWGKSVSLTPEEWREVLSAQNAIVKACAEAEKGVMSR